MSKTVRKSTLIGVGIYLMLVFIFCLNIYSETFNNIIATAVLVISFVFVYRCRNNMLLFVLSLFMAYSNYSIVVGIYYFQELRPRYLYPQIVDVNVYGIGIAMLLLFMIALMTIIPKEIVKNEQSFSIIFVRKENNNPIIYLGALLIFVLILILGYSRVDSGRGTSSALYEYNVIFLILMFFYSGDSRWKKILCVLCSCVYILTSFLNGTRVEAIICALIVFFCFFKNKISSGVLMICFVLALVFMNFVGMFRGDYGSLAEGVSQSFISLMESKLVFDTCTHAYFPALCMIEQFKEYSFFEAMHYFGRFLLTIVLGQSRVEDGDLIRYVYQMYYHNYGGVTVGFFYVWFSYIGSWILGALVGKYVQFINTRKSSDSDVAQCAVLYLVCTVPRWYLYGPWSMTRGVLMCTIVFWIVHTIDRYMRRLKL